MSKIVTLPIEPKDKELEEYLTSYFQAAGYFTERNIIEREATEVLELDTILYDYSAVLPKSILIEIKSGGWGFPEIFKIFGWKHYLSIDQPVFITSTSKESKAIDEYYIKKSHEIGVNLVIVKELKNTQLYIKDLIRDTTVEMLDISNWRYAYWIERKLIKRLISQKKSAQGVERYKIMAEYYHNINNVAFFTDNILDRLSDIYKQFQKYSGLTSRVANEIAGVGFECGEIPHDIFTKTFYRCEINDLTTATYLEYRSRLSVLKNVCDYIIYKRLDPDSEKAKETFKILGYEASKFMLLPSEMRDRIESLRGHEYIHLYPVFWQWFQWFFGGFILNDYKEREYELFSNKTGLPIDQIDHAFEAYHIIFPTNSWFVNNSVSNISSLKMFPPVFMGKGADYRKKFYTEDNEYNSLTLTKEHTLDDLIRWNNCVVDFLMS